MAKRVRVDSSTSLTQPQVSPSQTHPAKRPSPADEEDNAHAEYVMQCFLPPHAPLNFSTYEDYDTHYQQAHVHRCSNCYKNFPSEHFLTLHLRETHDALVAAQKARGDKTFMCFVEDCDRVCSTPQKRRMHLVDKHHFPRDYHFFVIIDGIDNRTSMLKSKTKHQSTALSVPNNRERPSGSSDGLGKPRQTGSQNAAADGENIDNKGIAKAGPAKANLKSKIQSTSEELSAASTESVDEDMEDLAQSMSSLKFVPPSVRFGRRRGGGLAKR